MGFDPVKGYNSSERNLSDSKVREGIKEIAQIDGAFVVSASGVVVASAQHLSAPPSREISLSKGLGSRHWAAAEITRATSAIAVAVSESSGTVRVFQNGEVVLRVEPLHRAMTWRDFETDSTADKEKPTKSDKSASKSDKATKPRSAKPKAKEEDSSSS